MDLAAFAVSLLALAFALVGATKDRSPRRIPAPVASSPRTLTWTPAEPIWVWYRRNRSAPARRAVWRPGRR